MTELHIIEERSTGREDGPSLQEQVRGVDIEINAVAELLVSEGGFLWSGKPLSGYGEGEVIVEEGSMAVSYTRDSQLRAWLLLRQESKTYRMYRMARIDGEDLPAVQELEEPMLADDSDVKYERDQLLDVIHGCQRDRLGRDSLPDF